MIGLLKVQRYRVVHPTVNTNCRQGTYQRVTFSGTNGVDMINMFGVIGFFRCAYTIESANKSLYILAWLRRISFQVRRYFSFTLRIAPCKPSIRAFQPIIA